LHSTDTSSIKRYRLYGSSEKTDAKLLVDSTTAGMFQNYEISLNDSLFFSEDGKRLYFFTAPKILSAPKDTLLDEEKYKLDLWNWQDGQLITQQLHDLDKEKRRTYLAVYNLDLNTFVQIADSNITEINLIQKGNYNYALGSSYKPYEKLVSWEDARYRDYYLINLNTGEKQIIQEKKKFGTSLTSSGNFLVWYEPADSSWKSYNITDTKTIILTENIPVKFYDEEFDIPNDPTPYGIAGLGRNDDFVLIYDKYDIWKFSPAGKFEPLNLTKTGRDTKTIFRYVKTETDSVTVEDKILLKAFNEETYLEGFFELDLNSGKLTEKIMNDYGYTFIEKSKKSGKIIWQKYSYTEYPDLWVSDVNFSSPVKISNTNPQQEKYIWGKVEVFNWSFDGKKMKGLIYKPENYDSTIKYPAIVYYYEKHTDRIHNHYIPNPSRSVVNFPLYNSNGYIIFSPDITYEIGYPGKSALNTVISGTNALIDKGIIDKDRVGLQGQSWGGYQTAYIVTQTNMFRAAMAGAPVVNMTSAYGGIRWESGLVREFQYEQAQSRIGKTLWDGFDLYIENSPLFFADKIETPLLLMANDNDGAVPWQQGIEFFTALRRLNKPSWMLTYNGDEHNLTKWPNRVDLSIRMKQFFDYYLKGEPMPLWMSDGIRAIDKGIKSGYELK
jgi:dipeptidyl aminopeptidase/acylaminoacyl peptidase